MPVENSNTCANVLHRMEMTVVQVGEVLTGVLLIDTEILNIIHGNR